MDCYAVFGNPIAHSISPRLHNVAFRALDVDGFYGRVLLENGEDLVSEFRVLALRGANITVPFKEFALVLADEQDETANAIGSANTLVLKQHKIKAYNTDAPGFMKSVSEFGVIKSALIIGAGGTARALAYILAQNGTKVSVLNRSEKRAKNFSEFRFFALANFSVENYDLVVNTTPAGLIDNELPVGEKLLRDVFASSKFAFDVIYGKKTKFLDLAKEMKLDVKDGKEMLLYQAIFAFDLFTEGEFEFTEIKKSMLYALNL